VVRFETQGPGHHRRREPKLTRTPSQSPYMHKSFRRVGRSRYEEAQGARRGRASPGSLSGLSPRSSPPMGLIRMHNNRVQEDISFMKEKQIRKRVLDCLRTIPESFLGTCLRSAPRSCPRIVPGSFLGTCLRRVS
jgi:hypothetical protein